MESAEKNLETTKETGRIEAFSDGVFAIAITLLVLDLKVPEVQPNESLMQAVNAEWASLLAFVIGFFTILICWINHHYMFQLIYRSNSTLLLLNGFKLLVVSFTPFATAILSKHIQTDWCRTAVSIYCFNFALMGIAMTIMWSYAQSKGFTKASSGKVLDATTRLYIFAGVFSTIIWAISFWSIIVCLVLSGIMFIIFIFPKKAVYWQLSEGK